MAHHEGLEPARRDRSARRLTVAKLRQAVEPGKYMDGDGLFLLVKPSGRRTWVQRVTIAGKRRDIGLGPHPLVGLARARGAAEDNRRMIRDGGDPLAERAPATPSFAQAFEKVIDMHRPSWRNGKTEKRWRATVQTYAMKRLGRRRVDAINTADVMAVLLPIWTEKRETARQVRQRIGAVMKWAVAQGYRDDNPAGESLGAALPRSSGTATRHRSLPHGHVADAIRTVRESDAGAFTKAAFEFMVLTAARSGEVRLATWEEIDIDAKEWVIPSVRMKAGREHRVPLSQRALEVLEEAAALAEGSGLCFPSPTGKAMSDSTLSKLVRENGIDAVPHGFRSSFRVWASERTSAPREVAEAALAHVNSDRVEAAYQRSDLFDKRRTLMDGWARYLDDRRGEVDPLVAALDGHYWITVQ